MLILVDVASAGTQLGSAHGPPSAEGLITTRTVLSLSRRAWVFSVSCCVWPVHPRESPPAIILEFQQIFQHTFYVSVSWILSGQCDPLWSLYLFFSQLRKTSFLLWLLLLLPLFYSLGLFLGSPCISYVASLFLCPTHLGHFLFKTFNLHPFLLCAGSFCFSPMSKLWFTLQGNIYSSLPLMHIVFLLPDISFLSPLVSLPSLWFVLPLSQAHIAHAFLTLYHGPKDMVSKIYFRFLTCIFKNRLFSWAFWAIYPFLHVMMLSDRLRVWLLHSYCSLALTHLWNLTGIHLVRGSGLCVGCSIFLTLLKNLQN